MIPLTFHSTGQPKPPDWSLICCFGRKRGSFHQGRRDIMRFCTCSIAKLRSPLRISAHLLGSQNFPLHKKKGCSNQHRTLLRSRVSLNRSPTNLRSEPFSQGDDNSICLAICLIPHHLPTHRRGNVILSTGSSSSSCFQYAERIKMNSLHTGPE